MRTILAAAVPALLALVSTSGLAQDKNALKPGMWEIVTDIRASEGPSKKVTSRMCYSAADVATTEKILPPQRGMGLKCESHDVRRDAQGWRWKLVCQGKSGAYAGTGSMATTASGYTSTVRLDPSAGGKAPRFDESTQARWVSECR